MSSLERTPRRRLSVEERRSAILAAARDAFSAEAYSAVSVPAVAKAADASAPLVFHYFGSKAGLYEAVLAESLGELGAAQQAADAALPENSSKRDRVRTWVLAYLAHVEAEPRAWASGWVDGEEPPEATALRARARQAAVEFLTGVLQPNDSARDWFAVQGFLGFLGQACLAWADAGCPDHDRYALVDAALGCLEGALGDWRR